MATLTFLDADVLIAAYSGRSPEASKKAAQRVLNDPARAFVVSPFLYLEIMPKPIYEKKPEEVAFFKNYFDRAEIWINDCNEIVRIAREEAEGHHIAVLDAFHVAAASMGRAEALLTLEGQNKPMYRTSLVQVVNLLTIA